jgi:isopentenyldiphosphate isomerase
MFVIIIADFSAIVTEKRFLYNESRMVVPLQLRGLRNAGKRRSPLEQFDVLDCNGRKTGARIGRDEAHANAVWHGAFHCLIFYRRQGRERALFQRRAREKKIAPGLFDVSVGGHYAAGEGAAAAGPREIREELGLTVPFSSLVPVGRRVFVFCFTPGVFEYEFQDVFLLPLDAIPDRLILQPGEVDAVLELDVEQGIGLFSSRTTAANGVLTARTGEEGASTVCPADFVPCIDSYYLKILMLARRYAKGEREALAI